MNMSNMQGEPKKIELRELEKQLGYYFKNIELLQQAVTHTSSYNQKEQNHIHRFQRLEFLGDSVINLAVTEYLYHKFPFSSEGELSKLKSIIISQPFLVSFANHVALKKYIHLGKSVDLVRGRGKFSILADCMESCLGAIYLDGGFGDCVRIISHFIDLKQDDLLSENTIRDYKTLLQEKTQKKLNCLPAYKMIKEEGLEHQKKFYVEVLVKGHFYGKGIGKNKKEAEQKAAFQALKQLKEK